MSRNPGLGKFMVSKLPKLPYILVNGYKKRLPRFYKDLMFNKLEKIEIRKKMEEENKILLQKEYDYLRSKGYQHPEFELESRMLHFIKTIEKRNKQNDYKRKF